MQHPVTGSHRQPTLARRRSVALCFATGTANIALGLAAIYRALGGGWQIREDSYFVST